MDIDNTTVIICCAGMGTRLGIGTTKALVNICGKPLILHQLELLKDYKDIRIVVGFQAEKVIDVVKQYRNDVMFAFNYEYESNGPAASLCKGLIGAKKYVIAIDGDLLVNPDDFKRFLEYPDECIAISNISSAEPILMTVENKKVRTFSNEEGNYEWPGLAKVEKSKLKPCNEYVFEMLEPVLPFNALKIRTREIDTPEDYENAVEWVKNGYLN